MGWGAHSCSTWCCQHSQCTVLESSRTILQQSIFVSFGNRLGSFRIIHLFVMGPHVTGSVLENSTINDAFLQSIIIQILTKYQSGCGPNAELKNKKYRKTLEWIYDQPFKRKFLRHSYSVIHSNIYEHLLHELCIHLRYTAEQNTTHLLCWRHQRLQKSAREWVLGTICPGGSQYHPHNRRISYPLKFAYKPCPRWPSESETPGGGVGGGVASDPD